MRMRVQEHGNEVHVELRGVAGRQQRVLQAISDYRRTACGSDDDSAMARSPVSVRAGATHMWIRLHGSDGLQHDAVSVYRFLRKALIEGAGALTGTARINAV